MDLLLALGGGLLWCGVGFLWWRRLWRHRCRTRVRDGDYYFMLILTCCVFSVFGVLPWLIVKPEQYRG